ncbi:MAG: Cna B-type domain-containing protein, partial [Bilifractor sp.]
MKKTGISLGKRVLTFLVALCMMIGLMPTSLISAAATDPSLGATENYDEEDEEIVPTAGAGGYSVSADPTEWTVTEGYTEAEAPASTVTVTNSSNSMIFARIDGDWTNFDLNMGSNEYPTYDTNHILKILKNSSATFTVTPKTGLSEGTYDNTVKVGFYPSGVAAQNKMGSQGESSIAFKLIVESDSSLGKVNFSYQWKDGSTIQFGATPTKTGKAYCLVKNAGEAAPSADEVIANGTVIDCTTVNTETIGWVSVSDSSAKKLYFVYVDDNNNTYDMTTGELASYTDQISEAVTKVEVTAERSSDTDVNLGITPTNDGILHFILQDADKSAPSDEEVKNSTNTIAARAADGTTSKTVAAESSKAQKLYACYEVNYQGTTLYSAVSTQDIPTYADSIISAKVEDYDPVIPSRVVGYVTPSTKTITIKNTGSQTITFTAESSSGDFTVDMGSAASIKPGETGTFTVTAKTGLDLGTHSVTITLNGKSGSTVLDPLKVDLSFDVVKADDGEYYASNADITSVVIYKKSDNTVDSETPYCINLMYPVIGKVHGTPYFNKLLDVDADDIGNYAGNFDKISDSEFVHSPFLKYDSETGDVTTRSNEDTLNHLRYVLYYGYPNNKPLKSSNKTAIQESGFTSVPSNVSSAMYKVYLRQLTQAAVWYFTNRGYVASSGEYHIYTLDEIMTDHLGFSGTITDEMRAYFDILTKEDIPEADAVSADEIQLDIYRNTVSPDGAHDRPVWQNLITSEVSESIQVNLNATKTLDGAAPGNNTFSFVLKDADGNILQTKNNDADGNVEFDAISFKEAGTYTYTVSETPGTDSGINYDTTEYTVTVNVSNNSGTLSANTTYMKGSSQVNGMTFSNTKKPETIDINGTKTWDDSDNQDGKRPASITIHLLANGTEVASKTVTAADNWKYTFDNLPVYANGSKIVYTITEDTVKDYSTKINGFDVTNSYTPETTSISGTKTWNDSDNQDGKRPASVTIH